MATNYISSTLADYTAADPTKVLEDYLLEGVGTKDHWSYRTGVKFQTKIANIANVDVDISTGAIGGYNTASGGVTMTDVTLVNKQLKIFEVYTQETLNQTILGSLAKGTDPKELPLKDQIYGLKGRKTFIENEKLMWQADTSTTVQTAGSTLNSFDGILAQLRTGAGAKGNSAVSLQTLSDASTLEHIGSLVTQMETEKPEYIGNPTVMAMSPANFAKYSRALYALNGTVTTATLGADGQPINEVYIPGTSIKVVSTIGLNGKNNIVLSIPQNIIAVYDLVDESDSLNFIENPFAHWHELTGFYKLGSHVVDVSNCIVSE